jgi:hypothetical protein
MKYNKFTTPVKIEISGVGTIESKDLLLKVEVDEAIAELKAENKELREDCSSQTEKLCVEKENVWQLENALKEKLRDLWIMTAEWAEAMGLASCNIASKFMSRENFEVGDDYRNNTIKKYRHRQVVFCKYADYCREKAKEYK